jgi:hypothetical protein
MLWREEGFCRMLAEGGRFARVEPWRRMTAFVRA